MRLLFSILLFLLISFFFSSCENCYTCELPCRECKVVDEGGELIVQYSRYCGVDNVTTMRAECIEVAAASPSYTCSCAENVIEEFEECTKGSDTEEWLQAQEEEGYFCEEQ